MAPFLFRGVKRASISCTSPASIATRTNYSGLGFDRRQTSRKSPGESSRNLLHREDDCPFSDSDEDLVPQLTRIKSARFQIVTGEDSAVLKPSRFSTSYSADSSRAQGLNQLASSSFPSLPLTRIKITRGGDSPFPSSRSETDATKPSPLNGLQPHAAFRSSSSLSERRFVSSRAQEQVVVLRVSLHCKACEAKVKKHLSRMEGVRSFDVDFATKKVTVVGDVTPLSLLSSFSKVKNAQLWTSPSPAMALI